MAYIYFFVKLCQAEVLDVPKMLLNEDFSCHKRMMVEFQILEALIFIVQSNDQDILQASDLLVK